MILRDILALFNVRRTNLGILQKYWRYSKKSLKMWRRNAKNDSKRILHVWELKIPIRVILILNRPSTFFHMGSRELRKNSFRVISKKVLKKTENQYLLKYLPFPIQTYCGNFELLSSKYVELWGVKEREVFLGSGRVGPGRFSTVIGSTSKKKSFLFYERHS